jgi:thiamine biosynthesis lipoprotein
VSLEKLHTLENMMSVYRDGSEVSMLNRFAGRTAVNVSDELMTVLEKAHEIMRISEGAFNIMLAPVVRLWRKAGAENKLPSAEIIKQVLQLCKSENLVLDNSKGTAYLNKKECSIDLGGIAKGFSADVCCDLYREMGASAAFINLGGNVKAFGNRQDGKQWAIGLQHPDKPRGDCYAAIMCSNQSVVTSGNYERYREINGEKYHHIIDGKTGYPAESNLKSVTVISQNSMEADALSTAAFVMGLENGLDLIYRSNCTAIFFTAADEIYITKGTKQRFKLFENLPCYEI